MLRTCTQKASSHLAAHEPSCYGHYTTDLPAPPGSFLKGTWTRRWYLLCCGKASQLAPISCLILPVLESGIAQLPAFGLGCATEGR